MAWNVLLSDQYFDFGSCSAPAYLWNYYVKAEGVNIKIIIVHKLSTLHALVQVTMSNKHKNTARALRSHIEDINWKVMALQYYFRWLSKTKASTAMFSGH